MRSNRYTRTVRLDGAEKSKKHYSGQNYRAPLLVGNPKSRKNRKQKQAVYQNKSAQVFARVCLAVLLLIAAIVIIAIITILIWKN